ncbi:hypothetical protein BU14_2072s0002 [Porphyra umbilicalis]|uniref:Uncharacterized protein n=1 Tax=Porphyra umbilicalis TaxID=2786 RepID=A0A1X6NK08_PORUM|nr:hypothetical protein BU14_2072s0002 [Porphyra umbilicalis]|eukprot:OSX68935.1 hypothetical protein BU14_2072s0002 [Porphyra umbilicalis]
MSWSARTSSCRTRCGLRGSASSSSTRSTALASTKRKRCAPASRRSTRPSSLPRPSPAPSTCRSPASATRPSCRRPRPAASRSSPPSRRSARATCGRRCRRSWLGAAKSFTSSPALAALRQRSRGWRSSSRGCGCSPPTGRCGTWRPASGRLRSAKPTCSSARRLLRMGSTCRASTRLSCRTRATLGSRSCTSCAAASAGRASKRTRGCSTRRPRPRRRQESPTAAAAAAARGGRARSAGRGAPTMTRRSASSRSPSCLNSAPALRLRSGTCSCGALARCSGWSSTATRRWVGTSTRRC